MSAVYSPALKYSGNYSDMDSRNTHIHQQRISGLLRYRSVPSSALGKMVEREGGLTGLDHQQHERRYYVPCFDAEMGGMLDSGSNNGWSNVKQEGGGMGGGSVFCNEADQLIYSSHEGFQEFAVSGSGSSVMMMNSFQNSTQSKIASGNCSNNLLLRQKSSPTGFFSNLSLTNALGEQDATSTSGLNGGAFTFSSEPSSSHPRRMPQIAENGNDTLENQKEQQEEEARTCVETTRLRNDKGSHHKSYMPSFTSDFWESSSFSAHKTASSDSEFLFSTSSDALESQQADQFRYQNAGLTHQMSLPSSSTKPGGIERILHSQGSVPCKIRAKRGFATHPRSIAERVRRTRISERINKLQELFPKSDKQTNTADMLDLAVDYIKDLQKQVKILTKTRAKCRCSGVQKQ